MSRGVIAVKPWMCAFCDQEQPKGSVKRTLRTGLQIPYGLGWAFVDGEFAVCAACVTAHGDLAESCCTTPDRGDCDGDCKR